MAWAIQAGGDVGFAITKLLLTLPASIVLLTHVRFSLARRAIEALLVVYLGLMAWHAVVFAG